MTEDKYQQMERLLNMLHYLNQNPAGVSPQQLARKFNVSVRTIYRDRRYLESLAGAIACVDKKWVIDEHAVLPPVKLTLLEAMTIFIAARLLLGYSNAYNPSVDSALLKLSSIVPQPLRDQIRETITWMEKKGMDERFLRTLESLAHAWVDRRSVKIYYRTLDDEEPAERIIDPYFIQPGALEHATYVIGYCHAASDIRTFKLERIRTVELLKEHYKIPKDFDPNKYLDSPWITVDGKPKTVKLRFHPAIARIPEETKWHSSQSVQRQLGGSVVLTMKVPVSVQLESFVLGWGDKVEVLEPRELRQRIAKIAQSTADLYGKKKR
ncbi:MAG: transcriptional regulator [Chloroflexi bacterium]|nr:transcriptional regulator [Chloroflexota bacterium]